MNHEFLVGTMKINTAHHLEVGGIDTVTLAKEYGTPLFVYDVFQIKQQCRTFMQAFKELGVKAQVAYASKAFSCLAMYQLMAKEGMSLDVVSGGELYTAIQAGFPKERIHFHGNNKTEKELSEALDYQIGCFVVDNFDELALLNRLTSERKQSINILLRVTPGVEAHTHDYIITGQTDSKFGFDLLNGQGEQAVKLAMEMPFIQLKGLHSHIGSQIFETAGFVMAIEKLLTQAADWQQKFGFSLDILNVGGGFGIRYTQEDQPLPLVHYIQKIVSAVKEMTQKLALTMPEIWIEPGRSIVGDAGITLYEVGSQKEVPNIRHYLAVDGGMTDNIRPALYDAKYTGILANRADEIPEETYAIAGKCCESGDMLIWDLPLPKAHYQDILAVFATGAYGYAMANNYNRIPRPAVIFVENNQKQIVVQRESYANLIQLDQPLSDFY